MMVSMIPFLTARKRTSHIDISEMSIGSQKNFRLHTRQKKEKGWMFGVVMTMFVSNLCLWKASTNVQAAGDGRKSQSNWCNAQSTWQVWCLLGRLKKHFWQQPICYQAGKNFGKTACQKRSSIFQFGIYGKWMRPLSSRLTTPRMRHIFGWNEPCINDPGHTSIGSKEIDLQTQWPRGPWTEIGYSFLRHSQNNRLWVGLFHVWWVPHSRSQ